MPWKYAAWNINKMQNNKTKLALTDFRENCEAANVVG